MEKSRSRSGPAGSLKRENNPVADGGERKLFLIDNDRGQTIERVLVYGSLPNNPRHSEGGEQQVRLKEKFSDTL